MQWGWGVSNFPEKSITRLYGSTLLGVSNLLEKSVTGHSVSNQPTGGGGVLLLKLFAQYDISRIIKL